MISSVHEAVQKALKWARYKSCLLILAQSAQN